MFRPNAQVESHQAYDKQVQMVRHDDIAANSNVVIIVGTDTELSKRDIHRGA